MNLMLFTVTVTALDGSGFLDPDGILDTLIKVLALSGVLDAAVSVGAGMVSFTGQVEAPTISAAISTASTAMILAGHANIRSVVADLEPEEEHEYDTLKVAVA